MAAGFSGRSPGSWTTGRTSPNTGFPASVVREDEEPDWDAIHERLYFGTDGERVWRSIQEHRRRTGELKESTP